MGKHMIKKTAILPAFLMVSSILAAQSAFAQAVPSAADPGKVQKSIGTDAAPQSEAPLEEYKRPAYKGKGANTQFRIADVRIEGVTVYAKDQFNSLIAGKKSSTITLAELDAIAGKIEQKYRVDGYVLANAYVNRSSKNASTAVIRVNEGAIADVYFQGEAPTDTLRNLVQTYAEKIKAQSPVRAETLERYLLLINDLPGAQAKAILKPNPKQRGAMDLVVLYSEKPVDASLSSNNRSSRYLGPWQTSAFVAFNNVAGMDERTTFRALVSTPLEKLKYYELTHEEQLGSEGTKLTLSASSVETAPGFTIKNSNYRGNSELFSAKLSHPFLRSRTENFTGNLTFDARSVRNKITVSTPLSNDRIRSVRLGGAYDVADSFKGVNSVTAELSHGLDILGATKEGAANRTNVPGKQDYSKIAGEITRTQLLPMGFSAVLSATGQYAFDALLSSEQFSIGGQGYGNAYDPGEISGDHGVAGKVELRYGQGVGLPYFNSYQVYSSYDQGRVWRIKNAASTKGSESLSSAAIGVRANILPNVSGNVEFALPLTKDLASNRNEDSRLFAGLTIRY